MQCEPFATPFRENRWGKTVGFAPEAPVVKWIERGPPEAVMAVRLCPGALKINRR